MKLILSMLLMLIPLSIYAKKCADFGTQKEAQTWYEQRKKADQTGWKSLDRDGDGKACDCLPGGSGKNCPKKK
ncbi:excalibur calcium-binding domain-containing protein [Acinetobacter sp. VNH17]|uniref:Excalibur calcium-binding domain-containing protein n=1 Tax=Acinetobacter thutiue TaxID=2998078 RepID=A0ABT7WKU3_9GAMM|nr:excalibur calcium-binding domain-containing protein [Acinetobacter thutiue]MCY6411175.1 excalibur calcium-binding domain-containing protein [Acinetobacter thutiue]MDN0013277.1 excalibur calcium-binding domain-containing protein [Acinetobacter thutiue]